MSKRRAVDREWEKSALGAYPGLYYEEVRAGLLRVEHEGKVAYYYPATGGWWVKGKRGVMRKARSAEDFVAAFAPGARKLDWDAWFRRHAIPTETTRRRRAGQQERGRKNEPHRRFAPA